MGTRKHSILVVALWLIGTTVGSAAQAGPPGGKNWPQGGRGEAVLTTAGAAGIVGDTVYINPDALRLTVSLIEPAGEPIQSATLHLSEVDEAGHWLDERAVAVPLEPPAPRAPRTRVGAVDLRDLMPAVRYEFALSVRYRHHAAFLRVSHVQAIPPSREAGLAGIRYRLTQGCCQFGHFVVLERPVVTVVAPEAGACLSLDGPDVQLSTNVSTVGVGVRLDGGPLADAEPGETPQAWSYDLPDLTPGGHVLGAEAWNLLGQRAESSPVPFKAAPAGHCGGTPEVCFAACATIPVGPLSANPAPGIPDGTTLRSGDLEGDGWPEIVTAHWLHHMGVIPNRSAPAECAFLPEQDYSVPGGDHELGATIGSAVADLNGDGHLDVAVPTYGNHYAGDAVVVRYGIGDGTLGPAVTVHTGDANPMSVVAADFDGDGRLDLAASHNNGDWSVAILLQDEAGAWYPAGSYGGFQNPQYLAAGDFNGDGYPDLAVGAHSPGVTLLLNQADGTTDFVAFELFTGVDRSILTAADFDQDGFDDVAVFDDQTDRVQLFYGSGEPNDFAAASASPGFGAGGIAAGDLNGDTLPDLVLTRSQGGDDVVVLLNVGGRSFGPPLSFRVGGYPSGATVADFDRDGRADIAAASHEDDVVTVLRQVPCDTETADSLVFSESWRATVRRMSPDGSTIVTMVAGDDVWAPQDLAIDRAAGKIYFTQLNYEGPGVRRANLDGSELETLYEAIGGEQRGIAIDPARGLLFYADRYSLYQGSLDGQTPPRLLVESTELGGCPTAGFGNGLEADPRTRQLYFVSTDNWSNECRRVWRVNYDGGELTELYHPPTVTGLDLDVRHGHLYQSRDVAGERSLWRSAFDGSGAERLFPLPSDAGCSGYQVDATAGQIYFACVHPPVNTDIWRVNLDGSGAQRLRVGVQGVAGLTLVRELPVQP